MRGDLMETNYSAVVDAITRYTRAGYTEYELVHLIDKELKEKGLTLPLSLDRFHIVDKEGNPKGVFDAEIYEYLTTTYDIFVLGSIPYIYDHGVYEADENGTKLFTMIRECCYPQFRHSNIIRRIYDLIIKSYDLQVSFDDLNAYPSEWINFRNAMYDPVEKKLIDHNPAYRATVQIPFEYHPDIETKGIALECWLAYAIPNKEDREMLLEYAGLCLTRDVREQKFLILKGVGGSGKSTLIRLIETMVGRSNTSNISLSELTQRFAAYGLMGKLLNCCADLEVKALSDTSILKKILGEDSLRVEPKGRDAISIRSMARLLFSTNELPVIRNERTNGFYRRLMVLEMNQVPERARPDLFDQLRRQIDHFIRLCVEAVERLYERGSIIESDNSKQAVKQMRTDSDSVEAWLSEEITQDVNAIEDRYALFQSYTGYCFRVDRQALTQTNFYKALRSKGYTDYKTKGSMHFRGLSLNQPAPNAAPESALQNQLNAYKEKMSSGVA